ncbi:DMT family transporter [Sorangium sp. So ce302]|jgi:transporter family-2 protein|uniref:DMT family transporter n=1 Tax=unclassified Sorangium TaxID=2621164 RepID=UPI003F5E9895
MALYILLALLNGVLIGMSRAMNGQLSERLGPFKASLWNHVLGFLFLTAVLSVMGGWGFGAPVAPPLTAYLGGLFGAFFVAVNSYVFPRLGAMNAVLLVISGQMISAVLIDYQSQGVPPTAPRCLGVVLVLLGVHMTRVARSPRHQDRS